MKSVIMLLGDSSASVQFVYPRHISWNGLTQSSPSLAFSVKRGGTSVPLHIFNGGGHHVYEGCCVFQNKWWMGGTGTFCNDAVSVLKAVSLPNNSPNANRQIWQDLPTIPISYPP